MAYVETRVDNSLFESLYVSPIKDSTSLITWLNLASDQSRTAKKDAPCLPLSLSVCTPLPDGSNGAGTQCAVLNIV